MLIKNLIEKHHEYIINEAGYSPKTADKYYYHLQRFFRDTDAQRLDQLTGNSINQDFLFQFWNKIESGKPLSNSNKINYLASLKSFLKFLYDKGFIHEDISQKIKLPKAEFVFKEALTSEEELILSDYFFHSLDTEIGRRDAALFYTLWSTGARIDEILPLTCGPDYIINTKNPIKRSGDFSMYKDEIFVYIRGKGRRHRMAAIDKIAIGYINYHLLHRKIKSEIIFNNFRNSYSDEIKMTPTGANLRLKVIAQKTGIQKILTTHVFRHTWITKAINAGYSTKKIMAQVGIWSEQTLEWYYRRDKMLVLDFAREGSPLRSVERPKRQKEFEKMFSEQF